MQIYQQAPSNPATNPTTQVLETKILKIHTFKASRPASDPLDRRYHGKDRRKRLFSGKLVDQDRTTNFRETPPKQSEIPRSSSKFLEVISKVISKLSRSSSKCLELPSNFLEDSRTSSKFQKEKRSARMGRQWSFFSCFLSEARILLPKGRFLLSASPGHAFQLVSSPSCCQKLFSALQPNSEPLPCFIATISGRRHQHVRSVLPQFKAFKVGLSQHKHHVSHIAHVLLCSKSWTCIM